MAKKPKEVALESRESVGARLSSPSAARNQDPIRAAFLAHMPKSGVILEIASGTGEHVVSLARALPEIQFLPGDPDSASRASIAAWTAHHGLTNVAAPHAINAADADWTAGFPAPLNGVFSIN
ncbi:MAG TPA: DUF938 domain-containing protein, partial [Parvularculaceae bacterium]|nr:DUF938 domain-containing protein [Parvularculaceae bacterium]